MKQIFSITQTVEDNFFGHSKRDHIIEDKTPKVVYYDTDKEFIPCENCNNQNMYAIKISEPHPNACLPVYIEGYRYTLGSLFPEKLCYNLACPDCGEVQCLLDETGLSRYRTPFVMGLHYLKEKKGIPG